MKSLVLAGLVVTLVAIPAAAQGPLAQLDPLNARAKSFELDTPYVPPPGDPLEHHTAGYAKVICSAVFMTGLSPEFAVENVGYFTSPYRERAKVASRSSTAQTRPSTSRCRTVSRAPQNISAAKAA